ncbi:hypothetical protein BH23ACT12_BH23ACT12_23960 [soil metagenome]
MKDDAKPGKRLYWLAAALFFLGGALSFVLWTVGTRNHLLHDQTQMEELARVPVSPEGRVINLSAGGNAVFVEHQVGDGAIDLIGVEIVSVATGERVAQFEPNEPWSYRQDDLVGEVYSEFGIDQPGDYRVTARPLDREATITAEVAVGPWSTNRSANLMIAVGMSALAMSLMSGFVLAFVTFFMRRKSRRAQGPPANLPPG